MASAVSPSASAQFLPTSKTIVALNSCLRRRISAAALNRYSARLVTGVYCQSLKASYAASIA